jgi:hypothetical protein
MSEAAHSSDSATVANVTGNDERTLEMRLQGGFVDFRGDLARDGFAVVKGAVTLDRAKVYADKFYQYLEDL